MTATSVRAEKAKPGEAESAQQRHDQSASFGPGKVYDDVFHHDRTRVSWLFLTSFPHLLLVQ